MGGGYSSRLNEEIRIKRGLSYGVGSYFDAMNAGGAFAISTFTINPSLPTLRWPGPHTAAQAS